MMEWVEQQLGSWGRGELVPVRAAPAESPGQIADAVAAGLDNGVIAYGAGRSYGDAPLNNAGHVLFTRPLNRVLDFDRATGNIVCEPGVSFAELLATFLPRGYLVPVTPGTGFATLGGAVANDVHGKNHEGKGSFGNHVQWIDLLLPNGEVKRVSPDQHADYFQATVGGIGLTGFMLAISFRMQTVQSNAVLVTEKRIQDLDEFLACFESVRQRASYSVGWIDGLARGRQSGRGILETAELSAEGVAEKPRRRLGIGVDFPGGALNPLSVSLFNNVYYHRIPVNGRERRMHLARFLYPLDALNGWNRIYGKRGFYQFQCVLPDSSSAAGLEKLLDEIRRSRAASFLAVLKTLGSEGPGYLSFPQRGYTLALDFPRKPGVRDLMNRLERITLEYGGRIYLAKDACVSAEGFQTMYPKLDRYRSVLEAIDPDQHMNSDMARRLRIRAQGSSV
jgi:decaprenylphospho-beta-D-ribofuranose 2-oxidase